MCGRPRRISRQKFPKRTRILSIPSKPYSLHSVHSAIGSRMNRMIFRSFRKRNSSQKNTNTVYSEYSYSGIVPKERTQCLTIPHKNQQSECFSLYCVKKCCHLHKNYHFTYSFKLACQKQDLKVQKRLLVCIEVCFTCRKKHESIR